MELLFQRRFVHLFCVGTTVLLGTILGQLAHWPPTSCCRWICVKPRSAAKSGDGSTLRSITICSRSTSKRTFCPSSARRRACRNGATIWGSAS